MLQCGGYLAMLCVEEEVVSVAGGRDRDLASDVQRLCVLDEARGGLSAVDETRMPQG